MFMPVLQWFTLRGGVNECKYLEVLWRLLWSSYLCKNFKQTPIRLD